MAAFCSHLRHNSVDCHHVEVHVSGLQVLQHMNGLILSGTMCAVYASKDFYRSRGLSSELCQSGLACVQLYAHHVQHQVQGSGWQ